MAGGLGTKATSPGGHPSPAVAHPPPGSLTQGLPPMGSTGGVQGARGPGPKATSPLGHQVGGVAVLGAGMPHPSQGPPEGMGTPIVGSNASASVNGAQAAAGPMVGTNYEQSQRFRSGPWIDCN